MIEGNPQQLLQDAQKREEQKAWDMFAAAALTGISTYTFDKLINKKTGEQATWQELTEQCCKAADAMMEQRKARMG